MSSSGYYYSAACPECGSYRLRSGFCCDGECHQRYMAKCHARWNLPGNPSKPEPFPKEDEPDETPYTKIYQTLQWIRKFFCPYPHLRCETDILVTLRNANRPRRRTKAKHNRKHMADTETIECP